MAHPLHQAIGDLFTQHVAPPSILVKDPACGGNQHLPLFSRDQKSRAAVMCNPDLLVHDGREMKMIVEIDESKIGPTQIGGKFQTAVWATNFIHGRTQIPKADSVVFLQILDMSRLEKESKMPQKWQDIEHMIQAMLPLGSITHYMLMYGHVSDFESGKARQDIVDLISTL